MDTYGFRSNTRIKRGRNNYFSISVITKLAFHSTDTVKKGRKKAITNVNAVTIARNKIEERLMKKISSTVIQADCCGKCTFRKQWAVSSENVITRWQWEFSLNGAVVLSNCTSIEELSFLDC